MSDMLNKSWFALGKRPFNFGEGWGVVEWFASKYLLV